MQINLIVSNFCSHLSFLWLHNSKNLAKLHFIPRSYQMAQIHFIKTNKTDDKNANSCCNANVNQDLCNIRWMDKGREIDDITIKILSP